MMRGGLRRAVASLFVILCSVPAVAVASSDPFTIDRSPARARGAWVPMTVRIRVQGSACPEWKLLVLAESPSGGRDLPWILRVEASTRESVALGSVAGDRTWVVVQCPDRPGYSLHGPYRWGQTRELFLDFQRARTVRVPVDGGQTPLVPILSPPGAHGTRPVCVRRPHFSECIGVPWDRAVLLVVGRDPGIAWTIAGPGAETISTTALRAAHWGRVVHLVDVTGDPEGEVTISPWRQDYGSRRGDRKRVRLVPDPSTDVYRLDLGSYWVVGHGTPEDRLVEIKGEQITTTRIDAAVLTHGMPAVAHVVFLRRPPPIDGRTVDAHGTPVGEVVVTLSEVITTDALKGDQDTSSPADDSGVRRWVAETVSDDQGRFTLVGPAPGRYEFLAVHGQHGRVVSERDVNGRPVTLRLQPTARVTGRVLRGGVPAHGVVVRTVPDQEALVGADDPLALLGPATLTGLDGRFRLSLPPHGNGEVVIDGAGNGPRVRRRYEDADAMPPWTDLGDISMPEPLTLILRRLDPGCRVVAVGPLGSLGMHHVASVYVPLDDAYRLRVPEPGLWWLDANCGGRGHGIVPRVVRVREDQQPTTVEVARAADEGAGR